MASIVWADGVDTAWTDLLAYLDGLGFDRVMYAATHFQGGRGLGDAHDALILSNYSDRFLRDYVDGGLFRKAPVVRWAARNVGAISWGPITEAAQAGLLSPEEAEVVAYNQRHGARAGYAVSFPRSSSRSAAGIGLGTTRMDQAGVDALWAERGAEVQTVTAAAHLKFIALPHDGRLSVLTPRQREVLELVADGKTVSDVAAILERTSATVEKHLRLAREALNVDTTAQAIMKASLQNQFFIAEVPPRKVTSASG